MDRLQGDVTLIVIHGTGASNANSTITWFQQENYLHVSAHYLVDIDGTIYQFVHEKDKAHHATDWNQISIGVEHVGKYSSDPTWTTKNMYISSAKLVRSISNRWGIPRDRNHIVGHY